MLFHHFGIKGGMQWQILQDKVGAPNFPKFQSPLFFFRWDLVLYREWGTDVTVQLGVFTWHLCQSTAENSQSRFLSWCWMPFWWWQDRAVPGQCRHRAMSAEKLDSHTGVSAQRSHLHSRKLHVMDCSTTLQPLSLAETTGAELNMPLLELT